MSERKVIAYNRKASHDYFLEDRYEAGLELKGTEIKSIRQGKVQLKDAYISFVNNEAFIKEMHILLHRDEIRRLQQKVQLKGYTVVPISLYLHKGLAKLEIALAKGKDLHDKRNAQKEKDARREIEKALKNHW